MSVTRPRASWIVLTAAVLASAASPCAASPVIDPADDFIGSYVGPHNADLDVVAAEVRYDPGSQTFRLIGEMAGPIGTTATALYVWGFDRGMGFPGFASIGIDNVFFDSIVIVSATSVLVRDLISSETTFTNDASGVEVDGNRIATEIPLAALVSRGFATEEYTWNLWPRSGAGGTEVISDFAPDNSNASLTLLPEPSSFWLAGISVLGGASTLARRGRRSTKAANA